MDVTVAAGFLHFLAICLIPEVETKFMNSTT